MAHRADGQDFIWPPQPKPSKDEGGAADSPYTRPIPEGPLPPGSIEFVMGDCFVEASRERRRQREAACAAQGIPFIDNNPIKFITQEEAEQKETEKRKQKEEAQQKRQKAINAWAQVSSRDARALREERNRTIPGFERHSRKCLICRHPGVRTLEELFINWNSAVKIAVHFGFGMEDVVYRHMRAAGIYELRCQNLRLVAEKILEKVNDVQVVTPAAVLRAVRTVASLDDKGRWTEPPSTHIIVSGTGVPAPGVASSSGITAGASSDSGQETAETEASLATDHSSLTTGASSRSANCSSLVTGQRISNRGIYEELEPNASQTKERNDADSNRGI